MTLDEQDLKRGLKFIVGVWQVDYVVNAWSNDLAHIPAKEFKSKDGRDFSDITFSFFEDHTVLMKNAADGKEVKGEWEQTGWSEYHYTLNDFIDIPDGNFRKNAETLSVFDGFLVFSIGFLAIGMKKICDGVVTETKKTDIGDVEMSADDAAADGIVGKYAPAKVMSMVNDSFGLYTKEELEAEFQRKKDAGEDDDASFLRMFDMSVEFTADHKVMQWMKIPDGVPEEMIKQALEAGEIAGVCDGYFARGAQEWKCVDGKYYYDTGEHREVFGEVQSSWDELKFDEDGLMDFSSGMMKLKKIQ
jgi:hypothetical protein